MPRVSRRLALIVASGLLLVACDTSSTATPTNSGVTVKFVGGSNCSTDGKQPYYPTSDPTLSGPLPVNGVPAIGTAIDEMPHTHVNPPTKVGYNHDPPTSGCHYNLGYGHAPIQAGVYNQNVDPEYWVHNLEHGYIVVLYNCPSGCSNEFNQLHDWFKSLPADPAGAVSYAKVVVLPENTMAVHFAVVAWDWYDPMDTLSMAEVQKFYDNHVDEGPEGTGTP